MPLEKAKPGTPGFSRNVATEVKAGKPVKQAVAIAYKQAGERQDAARGRDEIYREMASIERMIEEGKGDRTALRAYARKLYKEYVNAGSRQDAEKGSNYYIERAREAAISAGHALKTGDKEGHKKLMKYSEDFMKKANARGDAAEADCVYEENGEFFFPQPGSRERFGPYASKAEARTAAVNAGVVADAVGERQISRDEYEKLSPSARWTTGSQQSGNFKYWTNTTRKDADEAVLGRKDATPPRGEDTYGRGPRNKNADAYEEGVEAKWYGKPESACPSEYDAAQKRQWKLGYKHGMVAGGGAKADAMTNIRAIEVLKKSGDEEKAWKIAKEDEGLLPGVTKEAWLKHARKSLAYNDAKADADQPKDLSDEALRLRISVLESDIKEAGRTPRGPNMTKLNRQLDGLVAELRKRKARKDTAKADSLPPLARALAAADSMYAKALDSVHLKDADNLVTSRVTDFNNLKKYSTGALKNTMKLLLNESAAAKTAGNMDKRYDLLEKASKIENHLNTRSDAERDLPGAGTTEGNYGIDGARDDARPEPLSEEDRRYWVREVRDRIQDAKAAIRSFEGKSPELAKEQKNRLKAAEETQKLLSNPKATENDIEAIWRKWKYA